MSWIDALHEARVHQRRIRVLAEAASRLMPQNLRVLDVGCGDGLFAVTLSGLRPDIRIEGAEVLPRSGCRIPVVAFDGRTLPFPDGAYDACLLIDVLHHTESPAALLREAARVGSGQVVLKDHLREGLLAGPCLRFMDVVGNRRHGVALPFNYLSSEEWKRAFAACDLGVAKTDGLGRLYPFPANLVFGRRLNFMSLLRANPGAALTGDG
jgi:SAM-dependent methyltransferase